MSHSELSLHEVEELAYAALTGVGTRPDSARALARAVAAAEADGINSHGLVYVPNYCEHVRCGKVVGEAVPEVSQPAPSALVVDAKHGFAHAAIEAGFEQLIPLALAQGCAIMVVRNSYNCGVLGYHTERLAQQGLVGLGFTNAPASIAPAGGKKPVIGTNPFSLAVPKADGEAAFVLDQSASVVAKSEIMMHARSGEPLPEGWALDANGEPTTDPEVALKGSMAPSGGYKGFGTGLMVEVFAAALSGALLGTQASPFAGTAGGPPGTGQCFIAINPDPLAGGMFAERIDALTASILAQQGARLPGQKRQQARQANQQAGIKVEDSLLEKIRGYAA